MRIGLVAKGLLIKGDLDLELVLMCKEKPTEKLLSIVCDNLPVQIQVSSEESVALGKKKKYNSNVQLHSNEMVNVYT